MRAFALLQILDVLTTRLGLRLGLVEDMGFAAARRDR